MKTQPVPSTNVTARNHSVQSSISAAVKSLLVVIGAIALANPVVAQTNEPANKTSAMIARGDILFAAPGEPVLIAEERVKTSKPTDLLLSVTAESSILTKVATIGSETQETDGTLEVFIVIDGQVLQPPAPAPVGNGNPPHGDTAAVVFANQAHGRTTELGQDDETDRVETYLRTKHASGFNWMAFNVGSGTHHIQVFARYTEAESSPQATSEGVIGNRSLIVQPVKSAVRETVTLN